MTKYLWIALLTLLLSAGVAQAQQAWTPITPGATAVCARGTPYVFFVRRADPQKLLIFFEGGGACWDDATCSPNSGLFDQSVDGSEADAYTQGIFADSPANPLEGYSIVFVSYCTGDDHLGSKEVAYPSGMVEHKGSVDANAALNWTFANFRRPTNVVVAGCSAGAIGSIYYAPSIARHYYGARLTQFGDAGIGVLNPTWGGFDVWGVPNRRAAPDQYVDSLYSAAARSYPRDRFAEYTSYNDSVQTQYYVLTGAVIAWPLAMQSSLASLQPLRNFRSYVAPGGDHCVSTTPAFYSESVNGVAFRDWFAALVDGSTPDNVQCTDC